MTMIERRIEQVENTLENAHPAQLSDILETLKLLLYEVKWLKDEVKRLKEK